MVFKTSYLIIAICIFCFFIPSILIYNLKSGSRTALKFSSVKNVALVPKSLRYRLRHIPLFLRIFVISFLLVGFARPRIPDRRSVVSTEGIAIQMVIDRSSSMRQPMDFEGKRSTRFDVVRKVFTNFVLGDGTRRLPGRPNDLIGLTSFAFFPEENCPLTLDHQNLIEFMKNIRAVTDNPQKARGVLTTEVIDDGTAIGDAIYHAMLSLINAEEAIEKSPKADRNYKIKSKIIILLTDGQQNAGDFLPTEAAMEAKKNGIKIYSIAVVPEDNVQRVDDLMASFFIGREYLDTREIQEAAEITGGKFYKATDGESLTEIYKDIGLLEKSRFSERIADYNDLFQQLWVVPMGLILLILEIFLRNTFLRKTP